MATHHPAGTTSDHHPAGTTCDHRPAGASTEHRPSGPWPVPVVIVARSVTAGLAGAMAGIHLHLWSSGYRHLHIIGILFLLNVIGGALLAVALLVVPGRLLAVAAGCTSLFTAGTLLALVLTLTIGLFNFKDYTGSPYVVETLVLESVGVVVTAVLAACYAGATLAWWNDHRTQAGRPTAGRRTAGRRSAGV